MRQIGVDILEDEIIESINIFYERKPMGQVE